MATSKLLGREARPVIEAALLLGLAAAALPLWLAWTAAVSAFLLVRPLTVPLLSLGTAGGAILALVFAAWGAWADAAGAAAVAACSGLLAGGIESAAARVAPGFGQRPSSSWWWWL